MGGDDSSSSWAREARRRNRGGGWRLNETTADDMLSCCRIQRQNKSITPQLFSQITDVYVTKSMEDVFTSDKEVIFLFVCLLAGLTEFSFSFPFFNIVRHV